MSESKHIGTKFEKDIVSLLKELEFADVDGARDNFRLGGVQIDAIAGWQNILMIFECTTRKNLGKKDLSEKINSFKGKMNQIQQGIAEHEIYKKYKKIWFILATKNIEIRTVDIDLAKKEPRIYIWHDDFLDYYADQYRFIKPYAKYGLLGELGIKPITIGPISVPAFRSIVNGTIVYTFMMNPRDLLEVSFVARRERGSEQYYQRIINEGRLTKIASYVKNGGIFPNSIILAFREDLPVTFKRQEIDKGHNDKNLEFGLLSFPRDFRSCWIIDGQHRLYAFANVPSTLDFRMPITAFEKLPIQRQRKYFLDINRNQKPVDSDLLWDLSADIPTDLDGVISNAVKYLNTHSKSPLKNLIYYPSTGKLSKNGKLKISALCIAIKKNKIADSLTSQNIGNPLYSTQPEQHYTNIAWSLIKYLTIVKEIFPKNWDVANKGFILSNGGMTVMLGLFENILSRTAEDGKIPSRTDYIKYLKPLTNILELQDQNTQKQLRLRATSEAGKSELVKELIIDIREKINDNRFGGNVDTMSHDKEFLDLENLLKELIKKNYFDPKNPRWLSGVVDEFTFKKAMQRSERNIGMIDPERAYFGLTLGECFTLLNNNFDKVSKIFINDEEYSFSNQNDFKEGARWIGQMRAKLSAHATGSKIKKSDIDILHSFMKKMQYCLKSALSIESGEDEISAPSLDDE